MQGITADDEIIEFLSPRPARPRLSFSPLRICHHLLGITGDLDFRGFLGVLAKAEGGGSMHSSQALP
jgi:hypothetical protein